MKTAAVVLLSLGTSLAVVAGALLLLSTGSSGPVPSGPRVALPGPSSGIAERVRLLEARVDELQAALDRAKADLAADRKRTEEAAQALRTEVARERERADAAASLLAGYTGGAQGGEGRKPPELDAFAQEVSKAMKQGIRQEFRRIADLITAPTPEALEQRRRQLKMFAAAFGTNAGLDQAQIATLETILNETDDRARQDLAPLLSGVEDYSRVDYGKVRKVADDSFAVQNGRFDESFPKEKSERLKEQLEPVRNLFGAMLDELERQATAPDGK